MAVRIYITDKDPVFTNEEGREINPLTNAFTGKFLCDFVAHTPGIFPLGFRPELLFPAGSPEHCIPSTRFYQAGESAVIIDDSWAQHAAAEKERGINLCMKDLDSGTKIQIRQTKLASHEEIAQLKTQYDFALAEFQTAQVTLAAPYDARVEELRAQARQVVADKQKALAALHPPSLEQFF